MLNRPSAVMLGLAAAFGLGLLLANRPANASAQPMNGHGKCCGVTAVADARNNPPVILYRAFEDGTVERFEDSFQAAPTSQWDPVTGK